MKHSDHCIKTEWHGQQRGFFKKKDNEIFTPLDYDCWDGMEKSEIFNVKKQNNGTF